MQSKNGLHVAIIMDGNGRWATRQGLPRVAGHRAGVAAVRRVVQRAPGLNIASLTLYVFSSENWRRPAEEVTSIFWLLRAYLRSETKKLFQNGVRLEVIGRRDRLSNLLLREIAQAERATSAARTLRLRLAVDYSGRAAITRAVADSLSTGRPLSPEPTRLAIANALTAECGDVDLLIRTGGEKRLSDFLLWESAYAELIFTDSMWPDFGANDLEAAVAEFNLRERRFGGVPVPAAPVAPLLTIGAQR